jgi:hypothetical protein
MDTSSKSGLIGAALIGLGCGLTIIGIAMVIPACTSWSLGFIDEAVQRGKEGLSSGVETAASLAGHVKGRAQRRFEEASKTAREKTAKAAAAVENAARRVREHAS